MTRSVELGEATVRSIALVMRSLVSEISERHYAAQWMADTEYAVWRQVNGVPSTLHEMTEDESSALRELAHLIDGWVDSDGFVPAAEWGERMAARSSRG